MITAHKSAAAILFPQQNSKGWLEKAKPFLSDVPQ
jgi:hypothetical protein